VLFQSDWRLPIRKEGPEAVRSGLPDLVQFRGLENARSAVDGHAGDSALIIFLKTEQKILRDRADKAKKAFLSLS